jgi:hypothetical protein
VINLRSLLRFTNAECVGVEIRGRGALGGSGLEQEIQDICKVQKLLQNAYKYMMI